MNDESPRLLLNHALPWQPRFWRKCFYWLKFWTAWIASSQSRFKGGFRDFSEAKVYASKLPYGKGEAAQELMWTYGAMINHDVHSTSTDHAHTCQSAHHISGSDSVLLITSRVLNGGRWSAALHSHEHELEYEPSPHLSSSTMSINILATAGCLLVAYSAYGYLRSLRVRRFHVVRNGLSTALTHAISKAVNFVPGYRPLFSPLTVLGSIIPATWWNLGVNWGWDLRKTGRSGAPPPNDDHWRAMIRNACRILQTLSWHNYDGPIITWPTCIHHLLSWCHEAAPG